MSVFPYEFDSDQNFFCRHGIELTQSDVLADLNTMERQLAEANAALAASEQKSKDWQAAKGDAERRATLANTRGLNAQTQIAQLILERDAANAALTEAVKGLKKMRDYADQHVSGYSHICNCYWPQELREQAKDALASIDALKVQPDTAPAKGA